MKKLLLIFLYLPFFSLSQHNHDDHSHDLHTHDNEFALGIGFIPKHKNSIGIHSHYIKGVGLNNKLGAGISFETILDDHAHHSLSLISFIVLILE